MSKATDDDLSPETYARIGGKALEFLRKKQKGEDVDMDACVQEFPEEERQAARGALQTAALLYELRDEL